MQIPTAVINTEHQLVGALQQGCQIAFKQLVNVYQERVINTCLGFVPNIHDAEDICQEAFIEIYRSVHKFRGDSKLSTWIYRVAVTKSLDHLKAKKRKKRMTFLQSLVGADNEAIDVKDEFNHPGVALENKERTKVLFKAISQLPKNQRIAYTLNKIEGMPYKNVADVLQISLSSVESLMFRAKKNLQKNLRAYYEKEMLD